MMANDHGVFVIPWRSGNFLVLDATCVDTFAPSYGSLAAHEAGTVASRVELLMDEKYSDLLHTHEFIPVAVEFSVGFGPQSCLL